MTSKYIAVVVKPKTSHHKREHNNSISHPEDHSTNITKESILMHHQHHVHTESASATPTHLEIQKHTTKYKHLDWQTITRSLSPSNSYLNLSTKKKEISSSNEFRKELSATFLVKAIDPATRPSPQLQDYDSIGKRPISVAFSGLKGKIEVRTKPSKFMNESLSLKLTKSIPSKDDAVDVEASKKLGYSVTPVAKLTSSGTFKVKRDGICINLREKNGTPLALARLEEKLLNKSHSPGVRKVSNLAETGFFDKKSFLRNIVNQNSNFSLLGGNKTKTKESTIYYQRMDDPVFRGIPLTTHTESGYLETNPILRKEESRLRSRKGTIPAEVKAKIFKKTSLSLLDSEKFDFLKTEGNETAENLNNTSKAQGKMDRARTNSQAGLPTVVSINFGIEEPSKDEKIAKEIIAKMYANTQKQKNLLRDSGSPNNNRSENASRIGQSRNLEDKKSPELGEKNQRPKTQSLRDSIDKEKPTSFLKEFMSVVAKTMIEEENQNQEDERPSKETRQQKERTGLSVGKKHRTKSILDELDSATIKEEQPNLLEKKLISQLGKDENLVGWGVGTNRSDPESVLRFNSGRWKNNRNEGA